MVSAQAAARDRDTVEARKGAVCRELRKRVVGKDLAAQTAGSAHGLWRLADSPVLHFTLPNAYFDALGLPRLAVAQ